MYELRQMPFGSHTCFEIFNKKTGNGFSLVPACGANVLDIRFGGQKILDGYDSPEALDAGKWGKSSILFPFPNRLAEGKFKWQDKQYQFPINNAATGNAIHGFVRNLPFEMDSCALAEEDASITCVYDYNGHLDYFPFPFLLELTFSITNKGRFRLAVAVENTGEQAMPFGFGWHPYFKLAEKAGAHELELPASEQVAIDDRMLPTGKRIPYNVFSSPIFVGDRVLDTCFENSQRSGKSKISLAAAGRKITIKTSAKKFPFFQVFTPPHRDSIALEPMTCNVDALNNGEGLITLEAEARWKSKISIRVR